MIGLGIRTLLQLWFRHATSRRENSVKAVREHSFRAERKAAIQRKLNFWLNFPWPQFIYHAAGAVTPTYKYCSIDHFVHPGDKNGTTVATTVCLKRVQETKVEEIWVKKLARRKEAARRGDERRREVRLTLCWMTSLLRRRIFDKWKEKGKQTGEMDSKGGVAYSDLVWVSFLWLFYWKTEGKKRLFLSYRHLFFASTSGMMSHWHDRNLFFFFCTTETYWRQHDHEDKEPTQE